MKSVGKILLATSIPMMTLFCVTYADESMSGSTASGMTSTGMTREHLKDALKAERENLHNQVRENLQNFKTLSGSLHDALNLSEEQKTKIEALRTQHMSDVEALKTEYEAKINAATTPEAKETLRTELREKLQTLNKTFLESLGTLVPQNDEAKAYIEARKTVFEENQSLRKASLKAREALRGERKAFILQQKENFSKKIGDKIDTITQKTPEKLDVILSKIETLVGKYESNTKLSSVNKNKILDQLKALKELIEDSVEQSNLETNN